MFGEINTNVDFENSINFKSGGEEYIIVYDGELYNANELRYELKLSENCSETEIFAHAYIEWREKSLNKFNGVFALAIFEKNKKRLFCARDKLGVMPLFYSIKDKNFIFTSDIKSILKKIPAEIDAQSIAEIILIGPGRTPGYSIFKNIRELEPGFYGIFENGRFKKYKYWDLTDNEHTDNFEQTVEKVRGLMFDAIMGRLDKQTGTLLSGGLDSSFITSVAAKYFKERGYKLHAFSVDYKDNSKYFNANKFQPEGDNKYIEFMKNYLDSEYFEHHQIVLDNGQLAGSLYNAVDARGLPGMADVDASLLLFCKEIYKISPIVLTGEAADEIFGGYPWYRNKNLREKYGFPWSQSTEFRKTFFNKDFAHLKDNAENYVNERYAQTMNEADISKTACKDEQRMKQLVNLNIKWFMQTLLERQNKMSGKLNIRAPFCDYRIAEYLYNVPWEYKDYNNTEKGLLRTTAQGLLPDEVLWRKKSPYPKTHNPAYFNAVAKLLVEIINEPSSPLLKIANKDALVNLIAVAPNIPWYGQLMNTPQIIAYFVQLNYWLDKYNIRII